MRKILVAVAPLLGVVAAFWWWPRPQPLPVRLIAVQRGPVEPQVANTRAGTLKACRRTQLSFNLGAKVSERLVEEGQRVESGQVLMCLRQDEQLARVREVEARLDGQRNQRQQRCLQAGLDRRDYQRLAKLQDRQLVATDRVDQSATRARLAELACSAAGMAIRETEANLALQRALLDQATLRAPFAGIIAEIGLLKALGARPGQVRLLFVGEAALLALAGLVLSELLLWLGRQQWEIPLQTPAWARAGSLLPALQAALLFAWLPANQAARLEPLEALRPPGGADMKTQSACLGTTGHLRCFRTVCFSRVGNQASPPRC